MNNITSRQVQQVLEAWQNPSVVRHPRHPFDGESLFALMLEDTALSSSDFYGVVSPDANFRHAALVNADFSHALLRRGNFSGANLTRTRFSSADLHRANFDAAVFCDTDFSRASLSDAQLTNSHLKGGSLHQAMLTGADFTGTYLTNVDVRSTLFMSLRFTAEGQRTESEMYAAYVDRDGLLSDRGELRIWHDEVSCGTVPQVRNGISFWSTEGKRVVEAMLTLLTHTPPKE